MSKRVAIVGAGVIGSAVAHALACEGYSVELLDRAEPGQGGASYGNAGHIAAELVQPLPSRQLLLGFWRELVAFDGPLEISLRRIRAFAPWAYLFARAAFRREINTRALTPLVKPAADAFEQRLRQLGRVDLLRRHGHYQVWFGQNAQRKAALEAAEMHHLTIRTASVPKEIIDSIGRSAGESHVAGLFFPDSAHVLDPLEIVRAFVKAATDRGATVSQTEVKALHPRGEGIEVETHSGRQSFDAAVVCAGAWAAPLLAPFGLRAPLEAAHGYHVELKDQGPHVHAPLIYMDQKVLVTPMAGRLRASTYMEFSGLDSAPDPRKPARLRQKLQSLGYRWKEEGTGWRGPRPVLPDYLPGIGRAPGSRCLFYALGHQHLGLTLAPITAELTADLVAGRTPSIDISAFDLRRFDKQY